MKLTNRGKMYLYRIYAFLVYLVPMLILFILNIDEYDKESSIIGFWGMIVLLFVVLAFKEHILGFMKKRSMITVSAFVFIFSMLMYFVANKMILISAVSLGASILSSFVSIVSDVYYEHSYIRLDGEKVLNKRPALKDKEAWKEAYGFNLIADTKTEVNNDE